MPRSPRRSRAASPGWPPPRRGVRRGLRLGAESRRHRRREGPAVRRDPGDAGLRPAAGGRDRPGEEGGGGLRARPAGVRSGSSGTHRLCNYSSVFGTKPTASRSAFTSTASGAMRAPRSRSSTRSPGVGPARRQALIRHFSGPPSASSPRRGRAGGRAGDAREDSKAVFRAAAQGRPRLGADWAAPTF